MTDLLPNPASVAVFALAVLVLNATPGVDLLLTISRSLQGGWRAGWAAALGINAGCVVHALAASFGLAALLALNPSAFRVIQWAGAAYLVCLGLGLLRQAWRGDVAAPDIASGTNMATQWADFRVGLLTNLLNPKVALFFLAFLPQFVPASSPHKTASMLLLGAWFVLQSLLFMGLLVWAVVATAARLSRHPFTTTWRRLLGGLGGVLFIALAMRLLAQRPTST